SAAAAVPASPMNSPLATAPASSSAVASAPDVSTPARSAPASSAPDPCLAPTIEKAGTVPVPDPDAVSLRVCHPGMIPGRGQSVVLGQDDANNIGKLLDLACAGTANCETQPDVVLRFGYRDGTQADVEIFAVPQPDDTGCDQPTASV